MALVIIQINGQLIILRHTNQSFKSSSRLNSNDIYLAWSSVVNEAKKKQSMSTHPRDSHRVQGKTNIEREIFRNNVIEESEREE